MENYKVRYLTDFVQRARTTLEDLESIVKNSEQCVRECYAEKIELNSDEFVKMILHDAIFIIEYFLRDMFPVQWTDEDRIVMKPWLTARLQLDFLLLENQLPFFILKDLYRIVSETHRMYRPFIEIACHYFYFFNTQNKLPGHLEFEIMHFVDLLRTLYLPSESDNIIFSDYGNDDHYVEEMYCASQLAEAGLIFMKSTSRNCKLDIRYCKDGVLEIPGFTLDKDTELYARNLMALEQLHYPTRAYITDYFRLMDFLIDTDKDVGLLRRKKILVNRLSDNCATIVNNQCDTPI